MRTLLISILAVVVFTVVSCVPAPGTTPLQPDGGVLGKVQTESDTQSKIKAWGQGPSKDVAFWQARNAGAREMAKDAALDINKAMSDSGWKAMVQRTCALDTDTGSAKFLQGGVRWEGQIVCQRQQLLDWLKERKYSVSVVTKKIVLPKVCLVPSRLFGKIEDLELNEDEKFVKNAALELLRDRDSGFQIDDYETLLRSWSSVRGQVSGDIDIDPQFAVEADMYIKYDISVDTKGGFVKASGTFEAIFVSTGKTAGNSIGNSKNIRNQSGARMTAIVDCAKNGIDQVYEDMMKNWKEELENGFYYRIYFTGADAKWGGKILKALRSLKAPDGYNPTQNKFLNGNFDFSVYVRNDLGEPGYMLDELDTALKEQGLMIDTPILQLRHALGYKLTTAN